MELERGQGLHYEAALSDGGDRVVDALPPAAHHRDQ